MAVTSRAEEAVALALMKVAKLPQFVREYRGIPGRMFRFDFAFPEDRIAVEIHGGNWTGGRHTRGKGFETDLEKKRLAILHGWRVLEFTASEAAKRPFVVADHVRALIEGEG